MRALLLVGGKGTRLRPLTDRLPKPMVPIIGRPLLERTLEVLRAHGVDEVVLSTCYRADAIERYFGDGSDFGMRVRYVREGIPLGTAGAIKNSSGCFDDSFFVLNADILSNINFSQMLRFHRRKKADVTIAVTRVDNPSAYGVIEYDSEGFATSFREKPKHIVSHMINAGVYIFEPEVLRRIPAGRPVSVEREVFPQLLADGGRIVVYQGCNYWLDIGTPEKYILAHRDSFTGRLRLPDADFSRRSVCSRRQAGVSGSATLCGPVYLGQGARVEDGAVVGPNVVVGDGGVIGPGCRVANSILWDRVRLDEGVELSGCIVTADCHLKPPARLRRAILTPDNSGGIGRAAIG